MERVKNKRPFYKRFKLPTEENLAQLPKNKPPCKKNKSHVFFIKSPDGSQLTIASCRYCRLRWIFRMIAEDYNWRRESGEALADSEKSYLSQLQRTQ